MQVDMVPSLISKTDKKMANKIKIDNAEIKRRKRKEDKKSKKISCRILIVCEGEKTEPNYFRAFKAVNNQSFVTELQIEGGGINTIGVVDEAIRLRDHSAIPYDRVWAVFDKDSFSPKNFNGAIIKARENDIETAWSNEAFELWYLFHFHNRVTAMSRNDYKKAISDAVNSSLHYKKKGKYVYAKNAPDNFEIMNTYGNQAQAIKWVETNHKSWSDEKYSTHNPCTTVYRLVNQLLGRDTDLIKEVMAKINPE